MPGPFGDRAIAGLVFVVASIMITPSAAFARNARDLVQGNLIQFNDNGVWCWFQDERAVIDVAAGKLVVIR